MYTLTTFRWVPPFAVGYVRDLRVRWALEEAGLPYELRLVGPEQISTAAYRGQQPFGQIPVLHDGEQSLFESGAILLHLGTKSEALLPGDADGRTQAMVWAFAALNSVEPQVLKVAELGLFDKDEPWVVARRPKLEEMALKRLGDLDAWLANRDFLTGRFTVADILMTTVLRFLDDSGLVDRFAAVSAYKARCMARPAFQKALADQLALYAPAQATA